MSPFGEGNPDSGILEILPCAPNPGPWNPESKLHWHRIRNSVPEIQISTELNPESKTQDNCLGLPYMGQPVRLCFVILAAPALFEMTVEKCKSSRN